MRDGSGRIFETNASRNHSKVGGKEKNSFPEINEDALVEEVVLERAWRLVKGGGQIFEDYQNGNRDDWKGAVFSGLSKDVQRCIRKQCGHSRTGKTSSSSIRANSTNRPSKTGPDNLKIQRQLLDQLPRDIRDVAELLLQKKSVSEIASILNISVEEVRARIARIRDLLRPDSEDNDEE